MTPQRAVGHGARPPARLLLGFVLTGAALAGAAGCRDTNGTTTSRTRTDDPPVSQTLPLSEVVRRRAPELMALPGVVGVAEGALADGSPCLRVYVVRRTPELDRALPDTLDGWPVDIEESGKFRAMGDSTDATP